MTRADRRRSVSRYALLTAAGVGLLAVALWILPNALTDGAANNVTAAERLKAANDVRSTLVTLLAAAAAVTGLAFTARTYYLNVSGQVTDRYSKAVGQLGDPQITVRVGGIYALERVARDSPPDRNTIVEVLCTFIRSAAPSPDAEPADAGRFSTPGLDEADVRGVPADVQAALTVLGRRPPDQRRVAIDLRRTDLRGAQLIGADLAGAWLRQARLDHAQLQGAVLRHAWLSEAHLVHAHLDGVQLEGAWLRAARLDGAFLHGAHLEDAVLDEASLDGAWIGGAHLTHGQLDDKQRSDVRGLRQIHWVTSSAIKRRSEPLG